MKKKGFKSLDPEVVKPKLDRVEKVPADDNPAETATRLRSRRRMLREMTRLAEREVPKKKSFADVTCDLQGPML